MKTQPIDCLRIKFPLKTLRIYYFKTFKHFTHEVKIYGIFLNERRLTGFWIAALPCLAQTKIITKVMSFLLLLGFPFCCCFAVAVQCSVLGSALLL